VGELRKMWINCFPKAVTKCVVVGIEPATAGSQVRRPNHRATLLHKRKESEQHEDSTPSTTINKTPQKNAAKRSGRRKEKIQ
ncbi:hypothetical protein ElyMa_005619200, partial [Elysia marginata]